MPEIPEHLLRRSAEAKAKALGVPVEQVLAEMKGEAPPSPPPRPAEPAPAQPEPAQPEAAPAGEAPAEEPAPAEAAPAAEAPPTAPTTGGGGAPPSEGPPPSGGAPSGGGEPAPEPAREPAAVGARAAVVPRPQVPPVPAPEGVRPQRLLTVVKAKAIQQVKAEPTDKVNVWPHLLVIEFVALLAMTAFLIVLSVILQAPLLEAANPNQTPNPSKAPWYFLGLQELLSYFDPQIAGVLIPGLVGLVGLMFIPYVDRNPSNKPSDRKFAIMLWTFFLMGSATLTIIGTLFRGPGFNFTYPWSDGIWFDDLKDWIHFE